METLLLSLLLVVLIGATYWNFKKQEKQIKKIKSTIADYYETFRVSEKYLDRRIDAVYIDAKSYANGQDGKVIQSIEEGNKKSQEEFLKKIALLEFKLDNPAKYKVGDKAPDKGWVVTNVECVNDNDKIKDVLHRFRLPLDLGKYNFHWSYTSTNIKTGEVKTWAE